MLGRLLGHSPGLWRWGACPVLHPSRAIGDKRKDVALQTANPDYKAFKNDRRPTNFDKKVLVWAGRFKKEEDVPKQISNILYNKRRLLKILRIYYRAAYDLISHMLLQDGNSVLCRSEVLDAARNNVRIKVCYIMIALTLLGCLAMVITGKEAAKRDHTLLRMNMEKKAKWRDEAEKDQEAAVGKPQ